MPWKSLKQERWGNSPAGLKALGASGVAEFNQASKGLKLSTKVKGPKAPKLPTRPKPGILGGMRKMQRI